MNTTESHVYSIDSLRLQTEIAIEMLIALFDAFDGDTDLECYLTGYSDGMDDREGDDCDLEEQHDAEEDRCDYEPSLGWPERMAQGVDHGGSQDMELGS
jgi:hypothetical protein